MPNADAELTPFDPPTSEGVFSVSISSLPEGYNYSFTGENAKKVVNYFSEVELTSKYDDNPNEMAGMTLVVSITYQDGRTETLYEFSPFIRKDGGLWYKIVQNDVTGFHTFLNGLQEEKDETNFTKMEDLENWISDEWPLITDFKVLYVNVDTLDEPQHSKNFATFKASYKHNGEFVSKAFTFEITYDEFLILYDNNGYIVYNIEKEGGDIVTDINSNALSVLKKAFKENWQTYQ